MGSSVSFYAAKSDIRALTEYAKELGLHLASINLGETVNEDDPSDGPFCLLSLMPVAELEPYGNPPTMIGKPTDPTIEFMRSYYEPPYLISGNIYWYNDVKETGQITKPAYSKLARWIKSNWEKRPDYSFYFGPEAERLVEQEGAIPTTFPPDVTIQQIGVPSVD